MWCLEGTTLILRLNWIKGDIRDVLILIIIFELILILWYFERADALLIPIPILVKFLNMTGWPTSGPGLGDCHYLNPFSVIKYKHSCSHHHQHAVWWNTHAVNTTATWWNTHAVITTIIWQNIFLQSWFNHYMCHTLNFTVSSSHIHKQHHIFLNTTTLSYI